MFIHLNFTIPWLNTFCRITAEQHPGHGFVKIKNSADQLELRDTLRAHVVHPARCDFCQNTIQGTRYKCMLCSNFDLCQNCEALPIPVHEPTHSFLKLKSPECFVPPVYNRPNIEPFAFPIEDHSDMHASVLEAIPPPPSPPRADLHSESASPVEDMYDLRPPAIVQTRLHSLSPTRNVDTPTYSPGQYYEPLHSIIRSSHGGWSNPFTEPSPSPRSHVHRHTYSPVPSDQLEYQRAYSPEGGLPIQFESRYRSPSPAHSEGLYATPPPPPFVTLPTPGSPVRPTSTTAPLIPPVVSTVWTPPVASDFSWWPPRNDYQQRTKLSSRVSTPENVGRKTVELPETLPALETRAPEIALDRSAPLSFTPRYLSFTEPPRPDSPIVPSSPHIEERNPPLVGNLVDLSESIPSSTNIEDLAGRAVTPLDQVKSRDESESSLPRLGPVNTRDFAELWPELTSLFSHLLQPISPSVNQKASAQVSTSIKTEEPKVESQSSEPGFVTPPEDSPIGAESLLSKPPQRSFVADDAERTRLDLQSFLHNIVPRLPTPPPSYVATHVVDVNIQDGQFFPPGAEFVKTWRMRNDGERSWPETTEMIYVAGDRMAPHPNAPTKFLIGSVKPGEEVEITAGEMKVRVRYSFSIVECKSNVDHRLLMSLESMLATGVWQMIKASLSDIAFG